MRNPVCGCPSRFGKITVNAEGSTTQDEMTYHLPSCGGAKPTHTCDGECSRCRLDRGLFANGRRCAMTMHLFDGYSTVRNGVGICGSHTDGWFAMDAEEFRRYCRTQPEEMCGRCIAALDKKQASAVQAGVPK